MSILMLFIFFLLMLVGVFSIIINTISKNKSDDSNHKILTIIGICFLGIGLVGIIVLSNNIFSRSEEKESNEGSNTIVDQNDYEDTEENEISENQKSDNKKILELSKENESFDINLLHLDFYGVKMEDSEDYYRYTARIFYNNKEINNNFFNDINHYRIWSHNMSADFKVYQMENVYVLVSFIAKQCFENEVMIINTNGDVLKTFSETNIDFDDSVITIRTSDNGQCMGEGYEDHITEYQYEVQGEQLIEK